MNLPQFKTPYEILQVSYAHERGIFGKNVTIAVIDTGIFPHEDFFKMPKTTTRVNRLIAAPDWVNPPQAPPFRETSVHRRSFSYDNSGHGTHIAGIIGSSGIYNGHYIGIAPACNLIGVRILDGRGNGKTENMLLGIEWILAHQKQYNIRIVNISIGAVNSISPEKDSQLLQAVEKLWDAGIIVVAAAGNHGPKKGSVTVPGTCPKIITVGASDDYKSIPMGGGRIKDYSGRGPTSACIVKPEVLAPGSHILSCKNANSGYSIRSGTSMATPFVTGAIALLVECYPDITGKDVKLALYQSCKNIGFPKEQQGWGLLNIPALLSFINYM